MISASAAFKAAVRQNPNTKFKATLRFANGSTLALTDTHLMEESQAYTEGVSSDGSFDVGAAIIGKFAFSLDNSAGTYDSRAFEGATVTPYVGKVVDGSTVWIQKGIYGIEQPNTYGTVIRLSALDNMRKFERTYADVSTTYPATLDAILRAICTKCGVTLATSNFPNKSYVVSTRPDGDLTCLQMVAYIAQLAGCWARCDPQGRLELGWYDKSFFDGTPAAGTYANLDMLSNMSVYTDDVVVTGVRMKAMDQVAADGTKGADGESYLYGAEGYVLDLSGNPLCLYGKAQACATFIGQRTVGLRFRPFNATAVGDPTIQAGDPAIVTDAAGRKYNSYVTSLTYKGTGFEQFSCGAEYPGRNKAQSFSAITNAIILANKAVEKEKTARELAVENLQRQIVDNASGLFMTTQVQPDGSTIYYMHDQRTLAESQIVWKLTRDAFGISTNGGRTYPYGIDVNGDAILNRIYAIGIDADYIDTGALRVTKNGKTLFSVDMDTGAFHIQNAAGTNVWDSNTGFKLTGTSTIGNTTANKLTTTIITEYAQNTNRVSAPASKYFSTTPPTAKNGYYIWVRYKTVTQSGTSISTPTCLTGDKGATGATGAKGTTGATGAKGIGIKSLKTQYAHISSNQNAPSATSSEWKDTQPPYVRGKYYWTREVITWDNNAVTRTAGVLMTPINTALSKAYGLDDVLKGEEIMRRLTNNGRLQGMWMENGKLYLNGDYLKAGTVNAKFIKAGVIKDRAEKGFSFDLENGTVTAKNASLSGTLVTDNTKDARRIRDLRSTVSAGMLIVEAKKDTRAASAYIKGLHIQGHVLNHGGSYYGSADIAYGRGGLSISPMLDVRESVPSLYLGTWYTGRRAVLNVGSYSELDISPTGTELYGQGSNGLYLHSETKTSLRARGKTEVYGSSVDITAYNGSVKITARTPTGKSKAYTFSNTRFTQ